MGADPDVTAKNRFGAGSVLYSGWDKDQEVPLI